LGRGLMGCEVTPSIVIPNLVRFLNGVRNLLFPGRLRKADPSLRSG